MISFSAGIIGSLFTSAAIPAWYVTLNKASFNPPNWLFAPVWTILYLMMGIAMGLIISTKIKEKDLTKNIYFLFIAQLVLNMLWSIIFFGFKLPMVAFVEILILWGFILATIRVFGRVNIIAAYMLIPYAFWVTFASILNFYIVILN
ncbi:MAG: tryptophan-rich sensory protein [Candidatus Margulisbacteria bacterium]|nr:tryptophan-rich sensory protein [Candidatus Margulisiibacteriota bacterium]